MVDGIQNFLSSVNENWTSVMVIIGLALAVYRNVKTYLSKSEDEKIETAKTQIKEIILKMVTEAEIDFEGWKQAGSIKRSQVISKIFGGYPIFSKIVDQQKIIGWIDNEIDSSLKTLHKVIKENKRDKGE